MTDLSTGQQMNPDTQAWYAGYRTGRYGMIPDPKHLLAHPNLFRQGQAIGIKHFKGLRTAGLASLRS